MSYCVTTLYSVKHSDRIETYVYVIENHALESYSEWLDKNFHAIGQRLGTRAAIVKGYDSQITDELHSFLREHLKADIYYQIEQLFYQSVSFVITDAPLPHTGRMVICALPPPGPDDANAAISSFFDQLTEAISSGKLEEFLLALNRIEITETSYDLPILDQGFRTLSRLNKILLLQPSIAGLGINFNAMIDDFLERYPKINA